MAEGTRRIERSEIPALKVELLDRCEAPASRTGEIGNDRALKGEGALETRLVLEGIPKTSTQKQGPVERYKGNQREHKGPLEGLRCRVMPSRCR